MIGIIFIGDLKYCPYLKKYTHILDSRNQKYEVLFWNREGSLKPYPSNYLSFDRKSRLAKHLLLKLLDFYLYRRWLYKELRIKKYRKLIILSTLTGIILSGMLCKAYKNRYIFDIRDYSYEHIRLFYKVEERVIKNSFFTCISSEGFKEVLPRQYNYQEVHNFNEREVIFDGSFKKKSRGSTLNLVWIGSVRYFNHQKRIIEKLYNDSRFSLVYHGTGPEFDKLRHYCEDRNITSVKFTGEYDNKNRFKLLAEADIINNSYKLQNMPEVKYLIPNRYYDSLIYRIPQLVENDTFKQKKVNEIGVGIGLDVEDEDFAGKLYNYYFEINEKEFNRSCEKELAGILEKDRQYLSRIGSFINN